ncbi:TonB-dependent receptor family protein [Pseudomonas mangrovi]|uniref:TonB-dependent siderophore receptor n=1 Tax=Pseudomonas mangrovi TaxID=2161748 RepID=A0A2T5PBS3_9PSED|nr:TonB-dependent receptor [Pseudomonas mangrovi]PTU75165.1 TonB-dependent siderophore receptor [Pseudomonas mangrovi]
MPKSTYLLCLLTLALCCNLALAQPQELAPLTISAQRTPSAWLQAPLAIGVVEPGPGQQSLDQMFSQVPGVLPQSRYNLAQGLRLSVRGFGSRASFGVRGLRVLVDGVPLTMPDGQTELDGLDPALIERIEVIRGPASMLYGNAAGGVLLIETREPGAEPSVRLDVTGGELGQRRLGAQASIGSGPFSGLLAVSGNEQDGYREHASARTRTVTGKLGWDGAPGRLRLSLNVIDNQAEDPGALTAAELKVSRSQAAPRNLSYAADESIRQQRLGLSWEADSYQLRAHAGRREFDNRLPFTPGGQTSFDRRFGGFGGHSWFDHQGFGLDQRLTLGAELEAQRDQRSRHDNLFGARGARTLHQQEQARSAGAFLQNELNLGERWSASVGVRQDHLRLEVDDRRLDDGDQSGSRTLDETHYSAALGYRLDPHQQLYARLASSFESPTINELANPAGGGFNPALGAAQALNREVGIKGEWPALRYELALFRIDLEDELVPYSVAGQPGRTYYRNAGRSRREGVELGLHWQIDPHWRLSGAWSYSDFRFRDYQASGQDYSGNALAGVPRQRLFGELAYEQSRWYAAANVDARSHAYAEDANRVRVAGNALVNLRLGMRIDAGGQRLEPWIGIDNLFGREHFDNLRLNDANGRFFEPGPGRTLLAGVRAEF